MQALENVIDDGLPVIDSGAGHPVKEIFFEPKAKNKPLKDDK